MPLFSHREPRIILWRGIRPYGGIVDRYGGSGEVGVEILAVGLSFPFEAREEGVRQGAILILTKLVSG